MGDGAGNGGRDCKRPDDEPGPHGDALDRVEKSSEPVPHATKLSRPVLACPATPLDR